MFLDEPIPSIWSGKNWDLWLANFFRNRDLKPPTPMCRSWNSTPKKKKNLTKRSLYEEDIILWKSLLLFFLNYDHTSKKKNDSRFYLKCLIWMKQNFIWDFFLPSEFDAHIIFAPTSFNLHLQNISPIGLMANFFEKNNTNPKKIVER